MNQTPKIGLCGTLFAAVLLVGCQSKAPKPSPAAPSTAAPAASVDTTGATKFKVDGNASDVHILVFRGGAMARLGHNHVVSSKDLSGQVWLHEDLSHSRVELTLPVKSLQVDEPKARAAEGEDFAVEVPNDARDGTRRNLMREEVLDSEHFPTIKLQSVKIAGSKEKPQLTMRITIKGTSRDVLVPASMHVADKRLTATGEFSVKQSDFGMKPFSVAMGALQVVDQLSIKFSIVGLQE